MDRNVVLDQIKVLDDLQVLSDTPLQVRESQPVDFIGLLLR
jgi:hypothetical protein